MLFKKISISILVFILLIFILSLPGCISSNPRSTPISSPTINPTTSPPISSSAVPASSLSPTASITLPQGTDITFETVIESGNLGGSYKGESAQIQMMSSTQTPLPEALEWVKVEHKPVILSIDYSKYFVVMAFNGSRGGIYSNLKILRIWQNTDTVFVLAHFNDFIPQATSLPASNSQYQVVKINRAQITQPGAITFKLLDESGQERATTIQNISK